MLIAERDHPKNSNDRKDCAIAIDNEFSAFGDSAAGQFRVGSSGDDDIQLIWIYFSSVLKFEYFRFFPAHAWKVDSEGGLIGFDYDSWCWLCVEINDCTCVDFHSVCVPPCEYAEMRIIIILCAYA